MKDRINKGNIDVCLLDTQESQVQKLGFIVVVLGLNWISHLILIDVQNGSGGDYQFLHVVT